MLPRERQFWLLVLVNAFVGAMVGLERSILPLVAESDFGIVSTAATLAFVASFGLVKAGTNLLAGHFADRFGRRPVLLLGWWIGLPVPLIVMWAPSWSWVVFANVLLGVNQRLTWSMTVVMKLDLVGPRRRGLAMGLNEFAGYGAVSAAAFLSGIVGSRYGLRPEPFYLGIAFASAGLLLSQCLVRETRTPTGSAGSSGPRREGPDRGLAGGFVRISFRDRALATSCHVGLVNNLNDGVAWGIFPLYFAASGLSVDRIALLAAAYPAMWGVCQLATGVLSDRVGRKPLITSGMLVQAAALATISTATGFGALLASSLILGVGTALVYPTLLAAVADSADPTWRSSALGVYRLWRDSGYVAGALLAGALADALGLAAAIRTTAGITLLAAILAHTRMR